MARRLSLYRVASPQHLRQAVVEDEGPGIPDVERLVERILRDWGRETDDTAALVARSPEA